MHFVEARARFSTLGDVSKYVKICISSRPALVFSSRDVNKLVHSVRARARFNRFNHNTHMYIYYQDTSNLL